MIINPAVKPTHPDLLPDLFPAPWANEWGQDRFGLYMKFDCQGIRQRFRWILPGTFLMGSPGGEPERQPWETDETQHEVTLTKGFWLADTTVTQALWNTVMPKNPSRFHDNENNPVDAVSWNDAQEFIQRLNDNYSALNVRLPSEAEWEYACRAGTQTPFSFGNNITPEQVNYDGNYPYTGGGKGLYREKTVPVQSLPPNPWGLYEMHGNVWEWCADWYDKYPQQAVTDPHGPDNGEYRVLRGGSWDFNGWIVRSAQRFRYEPDDRDVIIGFRLAQG